MYLKESLKIKNSIYEIMETSQHIDKVMDKVKNIFDKSIDQSVAHKWNHVYRVMRRAVALAEYLDETVDLEVLQIAALLHDIDQPFDKKKEHVKRSIRRAEGILSEIDYPRDKTLKVLEIIKQHSSEEIVKPSTNEAKILFDADKLDGIGAIGIARVFSLCGQNNLTPEEAIEWYKKKIEKASPLLQTSIGRKLAEEKLRYVKNFFEKYYEEEKQIL